MHVYLINRKRGHPYYRKVSAYNSRGKCCVHSGQEYVPKCRTYEISLGYVKAFILLYTKRKIKDRLVPDS